MPHRNQDTISIETALEKTSPFDRFHNMSVTSTGIGLRGAQLCYVWRRARCSGAHYAGRVLLRLEVHDPTLSLQRLPLTA